MEILSVCLPILVSIISLVISVIQNQKLHKENKKLSTLPNLEIEFLFKSRIRGRIEKRKDAIDELNVFVSKYSDFYTNQDIYIDDSPKALFALCISNKGNGPANDITVEKLSIITKEKTVNLNQPELVFSCSPSDTKISKIMFSSKPEEIIEVQFSISYFDIINNQYCEKFVFIPYDNTLAELKMKSHIKGEKI